MARRRDAEMVSYSLTGPKVPTSLDRVFDVVVIGGGLNGAAVARDCAMRRLSVCLIEKEDFGAGGTGRNFGLLRGGANEIAALRRIAPNLVTETALLLQRGRGVSFGEDAIHHFESGLAESVTHAVLSREWVMDPLRFVTMTAASAAAAGAQVLTHTPVDHIELREGRAVGVVLARSQRGRTQIQARTVVNAAGAWAPRVHPKTLPPLPLRLIRKSYVVFDGRIVNAGIACEGIDGDRSLLLLPTEDATLLGATAADFYGDLDAVVPHEDEVNYLLEAIQRYFPAIREYRINHAFAGVQPVEAPWGTPARQCGEKALLKDHTGEGADGLVTFAGGALADHRALAERVTDILCKKLRAKEHARTRLESLPGCTEEMPWREQARRTGLDPLTVRSLMRRHGYRAMEILDGVMETPQLARTVCECRQILAAEVAYCRREEWVETAQDLARRTGFGEGSCRGCRCATGAALLFDAPAAPKFETAYSLEQAKQNEYARALHLLSERHD